MNQKKKPIANIREALDIKALRQKSITVLNELITNEGIKASSAAGWKGLYNHMFGRDSAIVSGLIFDTEKKYNYAQFRHLANEGLDILGSFQGHEDIPSIGEAKGKIPHEILNQGTLTPDKQRVDVSLDMWQLDPHNKRYINWDSADSTPLWIVATATHRGQSNKAYTREYTSRIRNALEWCLSNLDEYDGLAGFTAADQQYSRTSKGLRNQGWKDSEYAYADSEGVVSKHPIKDVFVNALFWSALKHGASILAHSDSKFSQHVNQRASRLKKRFNDPDNGFLVYDESFELYYFAEAIDGNAAKLTSIAVDPGLCLWADYHGDCIIEARYRDDVVSRLLLPDMLNKYAGLRNYSLFSNVSASDNGYHRSSRTYWPFVSGLVASGMMKANYEDQAVRVAKAMLSGISRFETMIELFQDDDQGNVFPWRHPDHDQESAITQAWTAAAVYYATSIVSSKK